MAGRSRSASPGARPTRRRPTTSGRRRQRRRSGRWSRSTWSLQSRESRRGSRVRAPRRRQRLAPGQPAGRSPNTPHSCRNRMRGIRWTGCSRRP
eukprot:2515664-Prymnesium_polylepis.1